MTWLHQASELAPYQDEPLQLPTGSPGKNAFLHMTFAKRGERSCLVDLERRAPLIVQQALYWDEGMPHLPCVHIISNSGGIVQGDRNAIEICVKENAEAHVTTQSATKIHQMDANFASQTQEIVLEEGAYLEYLPDPMIPHKNTRFITQTRISIAPTATLLYSEILMAGRKYYMDGELFEYDLFSSTLRAERPDQRELFTEKFIVKPKEDSLRKIGRMSHFDVLATVILLTPKEHADKVFESVPAEVNIAEEWAAGASRLPNEAGLIYKVLGMESQPVRAKVREFWTLVRRAVVDYPVPKEFAWR